MRNQVNRWLYVMLCTNICGIESGTLPLIILPLFLVPILTQVMVKLVIITVGKGDIILVGCHGVVYF